VPCVWFDVFQRYAYHLSTERYLKMKSVSSTVSSLVQLTAGGTVLEIFVTVSLATRLVMLALAPVNLNRAGTGLPMLNTELPSDLIGNRKNDPSVGAWYCTHTVNVAGVVAPGAVQVTIVFPGPNVLPEHGVHVTVRTVAPFFAVGFVYVTLAPDVLVAYATSGDVGTFVHMVPPGAPPSPQLELPPVQTPAWQVSFCVHVLPSLHVVPFGAAGFEQAPVAWLHVPAA
jgi:hypothetical protein